jgi:hypothetical protein
MPNPDSDIAASGRRGQPIDNKLYDTGIAASHNTDVIFFDGFQFALPLIWNGIILAANWHRPGGCQPIPKSELPP